MKGTAKLSIEAFGVVDGNNGREQLVITLRSRGKVIATLTHNVEDQEDMYERVGHWLSHKLVAVMFDQHAFHLTDESWGIQEQLPF